MTRIRLFALPVLAGTLALAACSSGAPNANAPANDQAAATAANGAARTDEHAHAPLIGAAWQLPDLTDAQRTKLQSIDDDLKAASAPRRAASKELGELFAKSLEDGKLDEPAANAKLEVIANAAVAERDAMANALNALHALLTPAQRAEVVERTRDEWQKHGAHHGPGGGMGMHMKQLADELKLTDAQRDAFEQKMSADGAGGAPHFEPAERDAFKAKMKAIGDAFASETFDAKALGVGDKAVDMAKSFGARMEKMIQASIEILDGGQRAQLAAKIREHAGKI